MGKSDKIYERPCETVPKQFFGSYVVVSYNYKAVGHILESEYNIGGNYFWKKIKSKSKG